jgi:hypothetical protein
MIVSVRDPLHGRGYAADLLALPARQSRLPPTRHGGGGAAAPLPPLPTAVPPTLTPHLPAAAATAATAASSKKTRGRGAAVMALACYIS